MTTPGATEGQSPWWRAFGESEEAPPCPLGHEPCPLGTALPRPQFPLLNAPTDVLGACHYPPSPVLTGLWPELCWEERDRDSCRGSAEGRRGGWASRLSCYLPDLNRGCRRLFAASAGVAGRRQAGARDWDAGPDVPRPPTWVSSSLFPFALL